MAMTTRKKTTRLRPTLESLESMTLLSTIVTNIPHPATAQVEKVSKVHAEGLVLTEAVHAVAVNLKGTIHATGKATSATSGTLSGSGSLGKVGTISFKVTLDLTNPPSSITLTTKHGKLYLAGDDTNFTTGAGSTHYTITGGTGSYAGATGSGHVTGSYSILKGNKVTATLKFSA